MLVLYVFENPRLSVTVIVTATVPVVDSTSDVHIKLDPDVVPAYVLPSIVIETFAMVAPYFPVRLDNVAFSVDSVEQ